MKTPFGLHGWADTHRARIREGRVYRYRFCDVLLVKHSGFANGEFSGGKRGIIDTFSKASARRFRMAYNTRPEEFTSFVTVTFPRQIFSHLKLEDARFRLKCLVRIYLQKVRRLKGSYIWVAEPQADGTPQLHFATSMKAEKLVEIWRKIIREECGEYPKGFVEHGTHIRPISENGVDAYMAKACGYMSKGSSNIDLDLLTGWRRWGRNYKSVPWLVEQATAEDLELAPYAAALMPRKGYLISQLICDIGVLRGCALEDDVGPPRGIMYNRHSCSLTSNARFYPF